MHRRGMTTYVRAPSRVLSHISYINSDLRRNFLICGYGVFMSLGHTMSFMQTMSAYDLCIYFYFYFVSTKWRHFFVPFSFFSTLYPFLSRSVSTLDSIISPPAYMLDSISSWFDLTLTTFTTYPHWIVKVAFCIPRPSQNFSTIAKWPWTHIMLDNFISFMGVSHDSVNYDQWTD